MTSFVKFANVYLLWNIKCNVDFCTKNIIFNRNLVIFFTKIVEFFVKNVNFRWISPRSVCFLTRLCSYYYYFFEISFLISPNNRASRVRRHLLITFYLLLCYCRQYCNNNDGILYLFIYLFLSQMRSDDQPAQSVFIIYYAIFCELLFLFLFLKFYKFYCLIL